MKCCQVWYDAPTGLYCVMNIDAPYDVAKVESILRTRQRSARQLKEMYEDKMAEWDAESEKKMDDAVGPTADAFGMHAVGKVATSGKGLRSTEKPKDFGVE